jgi:Xaa-Pro aminopeptidase
VKNAAAAMVETRIGCFAGKLEAAGFAAAVISYHRDVFYLAGTAQPSNLLVVPGREPVLFARRFLELAQEQSEVSDVVEAAGLGAVRDRLQGLGILGGRIGMSLDVLPAALYRKALRTLDGYEIEDVSDLLLAQRAVKDGAEVDAIRRAAEAFDAAHDAIVAHACPGVSELELSAEVSRALRRAGHDGVLFQRRWDGILQPEGALASGENLWPISALAIAVNGVGLGPAVPFGAGRRVLEPGDLVNIDAAVCVDGYHGDMARTYSLGEPSEDVRRFAAIVRACEDAAYEAITPDVPAHVPYDAARAVAEANGVAEWFQGHGRYHGPYIGHGLGLEFDEPPVLGPRADTPLEPGMVLTIEPKLIAPGIGTVNFEDDVVVGPDGCDYLSELPRELFVLEGAAAEPLGARL